MSGLRALAAVVRVEVARLLRTPTSFTLLLLVPALQVLLFGYAIRPDAAHVRVAVAGPVAMDVRRVADQLSRTSGLVVMLRSATPGDAARAVDRETALIGIELPAPKSFADPLAPQQPVRVVVDAANASLTGTAVARIETGYWRALAERQDEADTGAGDTGPGLRVERRYNPTARPDWTFLPALIGVTVMISMIMLGTLSLAREREGGTWEALLSLPIHPGAALAGKLLPYVVIGTLQGVLVLGIGAALFDLPMRGAVGTLVLTLPLFAAAHLALGYAMSARATTQLAALQGAVAFYLPAMLLSGFLYPFETLPGWAQAIGDIFPLTHFIRAARGALLRGDGADMVLGQALPIALFLGGALAAALLLQARRLD